MPKPQPFHKKPQNAPKQTNTPHPNTQRHHSIHRIKKIPPNNTTNYEPNKHQQPNHNNQNRLPQPTQKTKPQSNRNPLRLPYHPPLHKQQTDLNLINGYLSVVYDATTTNLPTTPENLKKIRQHHQPRHQTPSITVPILLP